MLFFNLESIMEDKTCLSEIEGGSWSYFLCTQKAVERKQEVKQGYKPS